MIHFCVEAIAVFGVDLLVNGWIPAMEVLVFYGQSARAIYDCPALNTNGRRL